MSELSLGEIKEEVPPQHGRNRISITRPELTMFRTAAPFSELGSFELTF